MTSLGVLCLWSGMLALAARRRAADWRHPGWWVLGAVVAALCASSLWRQALASLLGAAAPPLASPETAFLCAWLVVLTAILGRAISPRALGASLYRGIIAAAALGLALDLGAVMPSVLASIPAPAWVATTLGLVPLAVLLIAGLGLSLVAMPRRFPWDLPAWYTGLALMHEAAAAPGSGLGLGVAEGAPALAAALMLTALARAGVAPAADQ